jgi:hypothetical protein
MAKKKTLITMLSDNKIHFDFIENEKGQKTYINEFLSIDADNADEYAKTGNFSGIRIHYFTPDQISNFDKVYGDAAAWNYTLPILEIALGDVTDKQLNVILAILGSELKELFLDYSKLSKLELDKIVKNCPKLLKLELRDSNWGRTNGLPVELKKIGKQKFESISCENFHINTEADWSALNIESLRLNECETSRIIFPDKLKTLDCSATNEKIFFKGAKGVNQLRLTVVNESAKSVDLTSMSNLKDLDLIIRNGVGVEIELPNSLTELKVFTDQSKKTSLNFLKTQGTILNPLQL